MIAFPDGPWEAVRSCTPDFVFRLLQLVDLPYEDIHGTQEGILTLRSLKAEPLGELLHELVWDRALIAGVSREALGPRFPQSGRYTFGHGRKLPNSRHLPFPRT